MEVTVNYNNLSPGIYINEKDLTELKEKVNNTRDTVLVVGHFDMGEVETPVFINNISELVQNFGNINKFNQMSWMGIRNILKYNARPIVVRLNSSNHRNANHNFSNVNKVILNREDFNIKYTSLVSDTQTNKLAALSKNPGAWGNSIGIAIKVATQDLNLLPANYILNIPYTTATEETFDRRFRSVEEITISDNVATPAYTVVAKVVYYEKDESNQRYVVHVNVNLPTPLTTLSDLDDTANSGNNDGEIRLTIPELGAISPFNNFPLTNVISITPPAIAVNDIVYNERDIQTRVISLSPPSGAQVRVRHALFSGNRSYLYKIVSSVKYYYKPTVVDYDYVIPFAKDSSGNTIKWGSIVKDFPYSTYYGRKSKKEGDIISLLVIDIDGKISGTPGTILESFINYSCLEESVTQYDEPIEIIKIVNSKSKYIYLVKKNNTNIYEDYSSISDYVSGVQLSNGQDAFSSTSLGYTIYDNLFDLQNIYERILAKLNFSVDYIVPYINLLSMNDPSTAIYEVGAYEDLINHLLTSVCEKNKESVLIFSPPIGYILDNPNAVNNIVRFRKNILDSSYGFLISQWIFEYEQRTRSYYWVPAHYDLAGLFVRNRRLSSNYLSPAGYERGGLILGDYKLSNVFTKAEMDLLYQNQCNFLIDSIRDGVVLFGDKSLVSNTSVFNRINVRILVIELRKNIYELLKPHLFSVNTPYTRSLIVTDITRYLNTVRDGGGIFNFSVICDESNNTPEVINNNNLVVDVLIQPTLSVNYITLNIITNRLTETTNIEVNE